MSDTATSVLPPAVFCAKIPPVLFWLNTELKTVDLTLLPTNRPLAPLPCKRDSAMWTLICVEPAEGFTEIPFPAQFVIVVLLTSRKPPPARVSSMPLPGAPFCPVMKQFST